MDFYTDNKEINEALDARIATLSKDRQDLLSNKLFDDRIMRLCREFDLNEEEVVNVQHEVALVLMELSTPEELTENLVVEADIPIDIATELSEQLQKSIFSNLSKSGTFSYDQGNAAPNTPSHANAAPERMSERIGSNDSAKIQYTPENADGSAVESEDEHETSATPSYTKPMTDMPRYSGADPYREPPK